MRFANIYMILRLLGGFHDQQISVNCGAASEIVVALQFCRPRMLVFSLVVV